MEETMIRDGARTLAARLKELLDQSLADEIRLSRDEALLAQGCAEAIADLLTPSR